MLKRYPGNHIVLGCDEAGRGPLAGPVVAAAVILPKSFVEPRLDDSKKLSAHMRHLLEPLIVQEAIAIGIAEASVAEIDRHNILQATFMAMHRAIATVCKKEKKPTLILVDGNRFVPYPHIPHECIPQGDALYASIAAASILAKNYRDRQMQALAQKYPDYGWERNKGYGTLAHRQALAKLGPTVHHRKKFLRKLPTPNPSPSKPSPHTHTAAPASPM